MTFKRANVAAPPTILYLTNALPVPNVSGGQLREYELLRRLGPFFNIHLVAFAAGKLPEPRQIQQVLQFLTSVTYVRVDEVGANSVLSPRSRSCYAASGPQILRRLLTELQPRLLHLEGFFLNQHLPPVLQVPMVLAAENIEFELEDVRYGASHPYALRTRHEELEAWARADACVAVTDEDRAVIAREQPRAPVTCITDGWDHLTTQDLDLGSSAGADTTALYVANYSWAPSRDAAHVLVTEIWPRVRAACSSAKLVLAGIGMDAELAGLARAQPGIEVHGPFDSFCELARGASVFAFPMRFGGGIKVKLIEAAAAAMAVVTTTPALRGFAPELRQAVVVANDYAQFADAIVALFSDQARVRELGLRAQRIVRSSLPTWDMAAAALASVWLRQMGFGASWPANRERTPAIADRKEYQQNTVRPLHNECASASDGE